MKAQEQRTAADAAVHRGIAWLDKNVKGWRSKINTYSLDLQYPCDCVLGQLDGDFFEAVWKRELSKQEAVRLGFAAGDDIRYPTLTAAWKRALEPEDVQS